MNLSINIKWIWPLSLLFKDKKAEYEILPELTPQKKMLERALRMEAKRSAIRAEVKDGALERIIRGIKSKR